MKITEHHDSFEVISDDGSISKQFFFDDNPSRRAVTGRPNRKRALQEARAYAGKGAELIEQKEAAPPSQGKRG